MLEEIKAIHISQKQQFEAKWEEVTVSHDQMFDDKEGRVEESVQNYLSSS